MEAVTAPARLLVVDDEATILELLSGSLRLAGFEVVTAASGAGAVRAAASSRPDLVLLDVMMPDGDGFEALRRIRSGGCEVPVIFLTARDEVPDRVKGFAMGADDLGCDRANERTSRRDNARAKHAIGVLLC
jgi:two-component system, OmpR family, response regulator